MCVEPIDFIVLSHRLLSLSLNSSHYTNSVAAATSIDELAIVIDWCYSDSGSLHHQEGLSYPLELFECYIFKDGIILPFSCWVVGVLRCRSWHVSADGCACGPEAWKQKRRSFRISGRMWQCSDLELYYVTTCNGIKSPPTTWFKSFYSRFARSLNNLIVLLPFVCLFGCLVDEYTQCLRYQLAQLLTDVYIVCWLCSTIFKHQIIIFENSIEILKLFCKWSVVLFTTITRIGEKSLPMAHNHYE